jgi:hypothetical protein
MLYACTYFTPLLVGSDIKGSTLTLARKEMPGVDEWHPFLYHQRLVGSPTNPHVNGGHTKLGCCWAVKLVSVGRMDLIVIELEAVTPLFV